MDLDVPTTTLEGVGPATAERFTQFGVETVADLLRATIDDLHAMVGGLASPEEVRRWRAAAAFLELNGMTNQWAEALAAGGLDSVEELALADGPTWRATLDAALAGGVTPDVPDDALLADLRVDAMRVHVTGAVQVTVGDLSGEPVGGADVTVGGRSATTDARGRARVSRVPLGRRLRLVVQAEGFEVEVLEDPAVLSDEFTVGVTAVELLPVEAGEPDPQFLSELDGDLLPPLAADSMTTEARGAAELREGDVLLVRKHYADGETAQLTSKFLEYRAGTFVAVSYRVPLADLPGDVELQDHVRRRGGAFEPVFVTPGKLALWKAQRRARRATAQAPPAQTIAEREVRMQAYEEALRLELARGSMTRGLAPPPEGA